MPPKPPLTTPEANVEMMNSSPRKVSSPSPRTRDCRKLERSL
jgi:hypothetical protein